MKQVIVTGANGFVGYWLLKELNRLDIEVIAIVKDQTSNVTHISQFKNVSIVYCDLANLNSLPDLISHRGFDSFYHLAWVAAGGPGRADYNIQLKNVEYCCDAINVAKKLKCKSILFAGTISEKLISDSVEKRAVAANEIYAICKKFARIITATQGKLNGLRTIWMEFANIYGPYSINGNIVGYTIKELLNNNEALFGPADQIYDLLYIEDLIQGILLLGTSNEAEGTFYIGSGKPNILKNYLLEIGRLCGKTNLIKIGVRPDDGTRYDEDWFNIDKIKSFVDYQPKFSFESGIKKTIEWYNNHL